MVRRNLFACAACWGRLPSELQQPIADNYLVDRPAHLMAMSKACDWFRAHPLPRPVPPPEERCELTELLVGQCACSEHRGGADVDEETLQSRARLLAKPGWFPARYPGSCCGCGEPFAAEAAIRLDSRRGWSAECCADNGGNERG